jgi:hypothetical protein
MQNRRPSRPRQGQTVPELGDTQTPQQKAPRLPHERDESADSQPSQEPSAKRVGALAHEDATNGTMDTDKKPVMSKTYDKLKK